MKKLEELGISPAPWSVKYDSLIDRVLNIFDANDEIIVETDYGYYPPELADARMMAAAPELYDGCYELLRYYEEPDTNTTVLYNALGKIKKAMAKAEEGEVAK